MGLLHLARPDEPEAEGDLAMRSIVMLFLGIPIPVILLVAFCTHQL